jgi:release factor glutamine methyltransferase
VEAQKNKDITAAWAGGSNGSLIIYKFVEQLSGHIKDSTIIYLLLSKENEWKDITAKMKQYYDMDYEVLLKRKARNESLAIFKFYK